jgi:hypothetical protein
LEAQKLHLLAARQQALAGNAGAVRDLLESDLVFWREVLASSDLLISKMIAVAAVRRNFALGNLALRELPPSLADAAVPPSWRQPLTVAERSLARALGGEWHIMGATLQLAMAPGVPATGLDRRMGDRLLRPLFKLQATRNLLAARMVHLAALSELPYAELGSALVHVSPPQDDTPLWRRAYNPVGAVIDSSGTASAYADYVARSSDLEGQRRAALLVATLRGAGVTDEGAAAAVRSAAERSPYDGTPFQWDAAGGWVVFHGMEQGERGRHALLF